MTTKFPKLLKLIHEPQEKIFALLRKIEFSNETSSKSRSKELLLVENEFTNVYNRKSFINNKPTEKPIRSFKSKFIPPDSGPTAAIFVLTYYKDQNLNILLCERANRGKHGGQLGFPGGKIEVNETLEECAFRETFEEIQINSKDHLLQKINELPNCYTMSTKMMVKVRGFNINF